MNYLDSMAISNKYLVCSYPSEIVIVCCEVQDTRLIFDKANSLTLNCKFLKNWTKIFESYLDDIDFVPVSIASVNSDVVLKFSKNDFMLEISGSHLTDKFIFEKSFVLEIMHAISYMYIPSLCLNPPCTLIFSALVNHFESKKDYHLTLTTILQLTQSEFLELIQTVIEVYGLSQNYYAICSCLSRYKQKIQLLYKLRCYKKKNK